MTPIPSRRACTALLVLFAATTNLYADPPLRDALGDPLPEGAVARLGTVRFRHADGICQVTYAADGSQMATLGRDRTLRVWEAATGKLLHLFREVDVDYYALTFSPDGKTLVAAGGDPYKGGSADLRFFDLTQGKEQKRLAGHTQPAYAVAYGPDGKTLLSISAEQVICWDLTGGKILYQWKHRTTAALAMAPDHQTLAWVDGEGEDRTLHLTDATTGKEINKLKTHKRSIVSVAWSPDGKYLATGNPFEPIVLWDARTGKVLRRCEQQQGGMCLKFSADSKRLASGCMDGSVRLWDVESAKEIRSFSGYRGWVNGLAFAPDGKTLALAGADSQVVHRWDVATGSALHAGQGHQGQVHAVAISPDGKTVATGGGDWHENDQSIHLWDAVTGAELQRLVGHVGRIYCLQFSPDGKRLVSGSDKEENFRVWDLTSGKEMAPWKRYTRPAGNRASEGRVSAVAFSGDGKWLLSCHDQGLILLWDAAACKEMRLFRGHEGIAQAVAFSSDAKLLVSGSVDRTVRIWAVETGKELHCFSELPDSVKSVAFSPDDRLIAASCGDYEGTILLWETASRRELGQIAPTKARVNQIAFSPDGKMLAGTGNDNTLCLWEVATRAERLQFAGHPQGALALAFSPDGRKVVTGGHDTTVLLWDVFAPRAGFGLVALTEKELEQTWNDLASDNARVAHEAICRLARRPAQAVPLLQRKLRPITAMDAQRLAKALNDLDHDRFQVREKATSELAQLGELAEPLLRKTLQEQPSLEVERRVQLLLGKLEKSTLSPEQLRTLRAFEVLEVIGTSAARHTIEAHLEQGAAGRLGREAQACLQRLERRQ